MRIVGEKKRTGNWLIRSASLAATAVAIVCVCARIVPLWSNAKDSAALVTAGMLMPQAAAKALRQENKEVCEEHFTSSSQSSTVSSKSEKTCPPSNNESSVSSGTSSIVPAVSSQLPSSKPTPPPDPKKGKAIKINEIHMEGGKKYGNMQIYNRTNQKINFTELLNKKTDLKIKNNGQPMVLIYHTHTTEAYLPKESPYYYQGTPTRSRDRDKSVVMVGNAIEAQLKAAGFGVIHDLTVHDYPEYNGGYTRSARTIRADLKKYPSIQVTLDIHRDAIGDSKSRVKPTAVINGKKAAQFMILSGCDDNGDLGFPDWKHNLQLALRLQNNAEKMYPGLARPLNFCNRRYNENITHGSLLVEVGTEVNSLEEATYSGEMFGKVLAQTLQQLCNWQ